jgi:S1-C subfamily serine protease
MRKLLCAAAMAGLAGSLLSGCGATLKRPPVPRPLTQQELIAAASPAVVNVKVRGKYGLIGTGTGFLISSTEVFTPAHVVRAAASIKVRFPNGHIIPARIEGENDCKDQALLKLTEPVRSAVTLPLATSGRPMAASRMVLLNYGINIQARGRQTMSTTPESIINALVRRPVLPGDLPPVSRLIQGDKDAGPGSSGGALVDNAGNVFGMNVIGDGTSSYMLPAEQLLAELPALRSGDRHSDLGLDLTPFSMFDPTYLYNDRGFGREVRHWVYSQHLAGLVVLNAADNSPGEKFDFGDIIVEVNGIKVRSMKGMCSALDSSGPGEKITFRGFTVGPPPLGVIHYWKLTVKTRA